MTARFPSARTVRRAVDTLAQLPAEVLAQLAEAIIDRLDAAEAFDDREEDNEDGCPAEDVFVSRALGIGDEDDAEEETDMGSAEDEPMFLHGAAIRGFLSDGRPVTTTYWDASR